ncbi:MAG: polyamine aminopropyltransferase [bacterium]
MSNKRERYIVEKLNPNFGYFYRVKKTLISKNTKFQKIELLETPEFGNVLLLDNVTQVGEKNEFLYHEPMVHPALCSHPFPENILIIGAGDGGILREVLKHNTVKNAVMVELDGEVIEFSKKYLAHVNNNCFRDKRVKVIVGDGRGYLENTKDKFDVVIMDMTDPFGPSIMLYTKEFFQYVKKAFKDKNGILTMHTESPVSRPNIFNSIIKTLESMFVNVNIFYLYIQMYATLWSIGVCSDAIDTSKLKQDRISRILKERKIGKLNAYSGLMHESMQSEFPFISAIRKQRAPVLTDKKHEFSEKVDCNLYSRLDIVELKNK